MEITQDLGAFGTTPFQPLWLADTLGTSTEPHIAQKYVDAHDIIMSEAISLRGNCVR